VHVASKAVAGELRRQLGDVRARCPSAGQQKQHAGVRRGVGITAAPAGVHPSGRACQPKKACALYVLYLNLASVVCKQLTNLGVIKRLFQVIAGVVWK
jgi:hypothetical protein